MLSQNSTSLTVGENQLATSIGLAAPVDSLYAAADLAVLVTALPSNGTILLADGITPVNLGQSLTVTQLVGLKFRPALNSFATSSSFGFTVSDPAGSSAVGSAVAYDRGGDDAGVDELEVVNRAAECRSDADRHRSADRRKLFLLISQRENHCTAYEWDSVPVGWNDRGHCRTNADSGAVD